MKKLTLLLMVLTLCVPFLGAHASKSRTASGEYNTFVIEPGEEGGVVAGQFSNGVAFKVRPGERFVTAVLTDESGLPARATVGMDHDGDGFAEDTTEFCGKTDAPVRVHPGMRVVVAAQEGPCEDGTMAMSTFGTVKVTFTR